MALAAAAALSAGSPPATIADYPYTVELSVLTYNVKGLPWPIARNRAKALRDIGQELAALRAAGKAPDVVLIQEGFRGEIADLVKASGYRYWVQGPSRDASAPRGKSLGARYLGAGEGWGKLTGAGLHILSDAPIVDVDSAPYRACAGFDCLANKGMMVARIALPGAPEPVAVVNTHMNSRGAAKVPKSRSGRAHNLQTDELVRFIRTRVRDDALLVGGDFNVKNAPERYDYQAQARPYRVVAEVCALPAAGCERAPSDDPKPWLAVQDLHAFAGRRGVEIRPLATSTLFSSPQTGGILSDHVGQLVRYRLTWTSRPAGEAMQVAAAQ